MLGDSVKVVEASFGIQRAAEAKALLRLGFEGPADLEAALLASGWTVHRNLDGEVDDIDYPGPAFTREFNDLLPLLAAFVTAGSFIVLEGDDGAQCRWDFDGGRCSFVDSGLVEEAR
jgi:hypothetical protein